MVAYVEFLAKVQDESYFQYAFKFLDLEENKYIICTRVTNWSLADLQPGTRGYLEYEVHREGIDQYYSAYYDEFKKYTSNMTQLLHFVPEKEEVKMTV